ncbi:MAG: hypothetical protein VX768_18465 [Planctomycetota bacterium]|nr:hypothetical protein [Planctomycetota bacterium]
MLKLSPAEFNKRESVLLPTESTDALSMHPHNASARPANRWSRVWRVEWLGQTVASICWIISVFTYGIDSAGDWLQLAAACAWLLANIAAVISRESPGETT